MLSFEIFVLKEIFDVFQVFFWQNFLGFATCNNNFYLSQHICVENFKNFIETKFSKPLQWISNSCRRPTFSKCTNTFLFKCDWETRPKVAILFWIHLNIAMKTFQKMGKLFCIRNNHWSCLNGFSMFKDYSRAQLQRYCMENFIYLLNRLNTTFIQIMCSNLNCFKLYGFWFISSTSPLDNQQTKCKYEVIFVFCRFKFTVNQSIFAEI